MIYEHKEKRFLFSGQVKPVNEQSRIIVFQCFPKNRVMYIGEIFLKKDCPLGFFFKDYNESALEALKIMAKQVSNENCFGISSTRIIVEEEEPEDKKQFAEKYLKKMSYRVTNGVRTDFYWI